MRGPKFVSAAFPANSVALVALSIGYFVDRLNTVKSPFKGDVLVVARIGTVVLLLVMCCAIAASISVTFTGRPKRFVPPQYRD